ncbi:non-canonical purine NTP pyrophosphatase, RdgB/HAM1 family [Chitinophagaceae bacterium IBVUCB2]|nr:non-canonical purine NTP pyrophosphatase, RdgB/HAM1 family [Chitinophagaceae bacterium IBVUCB2]
MELIFATNNQHKIDEIRSLLTNEFDLITLKEAGIDIDIPEPYDSLEENASGKSKTIYDMKGVNCFSEDTGLEVAALNGEPGVKSARYAGEGRSFDANIEKLLINLADKKDWSARFRTVISLIIDDQETLFEGICEGKIIAEKRGGQGFGYDPVFIPTGSTKTFAEMSMQEKAQYSHRAKATEKLVAFLNNL